MARVHDHGPSYEPGEEVQCRRTHGGGGLRAWRDGFFVRRRGAFIVVKVQGGLELEFAPCDVRRPVKRVRKPVVALEGVKGGPARSDAYLAYVRSKPCMFCGADAPSDPHHVGSRGMGQKTDDLRCVPLCRRCHDAYHRGDWRQLLRTSAVPDVIEPLTERMRVQHDIALRQVDLLVDYYRPHTVPA